MVFFIYQNYFDDIWYLKVEKYNMQIGFILYRLPEAVVKSLLICKFLKITLSSHVVVRLMSTLDKKRIARPQIYKRVVTST